MRRSLFLAAMCAAGLAAALAHADDHPIYYYAGASAGSVTAANAWSSKNNTTDIVPADFESGNVIYRMTGAQVEMAGFGGTGLLYPTGISGMTVFIR